MADMETPTIDGTSDGTSYITNVDNVRNPLRPTPCRWLDYEYIYTYIKSVRYISDPKKRTANLKKHGYDFDDAQQVIESGHTVTFEDRRFDYVEQRFITLGVLRESVVVIATVETDEIIRIISMRKAERNEEKIYYDNL